MISLSNKVLNFMKKREFTGIVLNQEIKQFGWAGCRPIIRGEFIKNEDEIESSKREAYILEEIDGIKVFIPKNMGYDSKNKKIIITSNLMFFNMIILSIEMFEEY